VADKDGDFSQDFVVYDTTTTLPAAHNWYVSRSSNAGIPYQTAQFGNSSSVPVAGDFDGDTKDDFAVFNDGQWYIWKSTTGTMWMPTVGSSWARPIPQFHK